MAERRRRDASGAGVGPGLPRAALHVVSCERGLRVRPSHPEFVISPVVGREGVWSRGGLRTSLGLGL